MKKQAVELELGDRIDIKNGLKYEIEQISENKSGRIQFILYPYQNSMSARKKITFKENQEIDII